MDPHEIFLSYLDSYSQMTGADFSLDEETDGRMEEAFENYGWLWENAKNTARKVLGDKRYNNWAEKSHQWREHRNHRYFLDRASKAEQEHFRKERKNPNFNRRKYLADWARNERKERARQTRSDILGDVGSAFGGALGGVVNGAYYAKEAAKHGLSNAKQGLSDLLTGAGHEARFQDTLKSWNKLDRQMNRKNRRR